MNAHIFETRIAPVPRQFVVTVQGREEWPSKDYTFGCEKCANMFLSMCKRDGEYRVSKSRSASCGEGL